MRRLLAAMALSALVLAACGEDEPDDVEGTQDLDEETAEPEGPGEVEPPGVELLDDGEEPRQELRLALEEGTEIPATLTFQEEVLSGEVEGEELPPQAGVIELLLTVTEADEGQATISFAYEDLTIEGQAEQEQNPLEGVEGELVLDDRSRLIGTTPSAQGLNQLPVALPEEEVGVGAVWEIRTEQLFDLPVTEVMTVELLSLEDGEIEVEITTTTEGPEEPTPMPGGMEGAEVTLEELERDGSGQQRISLSEPFPIEATMATETMLLVSSGGQADEEQGPGTGEQRQEFREEITFERR
jgi:hypothetical protein